jgi:hypothetical protein
MNIFEFVEHISLEDQTRITPVIRKQIITEYSLDQWLRIARVFLKGLDKQHSVPGKDIQVLYDYLAYHREWETLTWEQQWRLVSIIIENWQQMTCESRANLLI